MSGDVWDHWQARMACRGNPNMNSLIGMGAVTSFTAGLAAPLVPGAALEVSFLEEPVMLLSFVLLGRALEARARLKASGDPRNQPRLLALCILVSRIDQAHGCDSTFGRRMVGALCSVLRSQVGWLWKLTMGCPAVAALIAAMIIHKREAE